MIPKNTSLLEALQQANDKHCDKHGCFECDFWSDDWECILFAVGNEIKGSGK